MRVHLILAFCLVMVTDAVQLVDRLAFFIFHINLRLSADNTQEIS